jgi:DNA-binding LytR/AlgR family response regulator
MQMIYVIIDEDAIARAELAAVLGGLGGREVVGAPTVAAALVGLEGRRVETLFIRISAWDEYRLAVPVDMPVVFLSGRGEKCTQHLPIALEYHLQPPYSAGRVGKCLARLELAAAPGEAVRMADLLFVRAGWRWQPVRISELRSVRKAGVFIELETRTGSYLVRGSMAEWAGRLPSTVMRVGRGLMVAGK